MRGRELARMAEKRGGGDRRSDEERREEADRRAGEGSPPPEGDRRSGKDRRSGEDRRSGKDRRPDGGRTLRAVTDADRERELRRLERDRRRRERGAPTYFEPSVLLGVSPDDPTVNLRPD